MKSSAKNTLKRSSVAKKERGMDEFLPNEVLKSFKRAKELHDNPDMAMQIDFKHPRGEGITKYFSVKMIKYDPVMNLWNERPLKLFFKNIQTRVRILSPTDPKRTFAGASLGFAHNATFEMEINSPEDAYMPEYIETRQVNGVQKYFEIHHYGEAKLAIASSYDRLLRKAKRDTDIDEELKINPMISREKTVKDGNKNVKVPVLEPIIFVKIPFRDNKKNEDKDKKKGYQPPADNFIKPEQEPSCPIYDADKYIPDYEERKVFYFEKATIQVGDDQVPLNYGNIGQFITRGSNCTGVENLGSICESKFGMSYKNEVDTLIVKHGEDERRLQLSTSIIDSIRGATIKKIEVAETEDEEPVKKVSSEIVMPNDDDELNGDDDLDGYNDDIAA